MTDPIRISLRISGITLKLMQEAEAAGFDGAGSFDCQDLHMYSMIGVIPVQSPRKPVQQPKVAE